MKKSILEPQRAMQSYQSNLIDRLKKFNREVFPAHLDQFKSLAQSQSPHTLFITCADSRVMPEMLTGVDPGELFVCRNIGNIVPAYGQMMGGVSAVIEYAVAALQVRQIVVCGHSDCGAMKALDAPDTITASMPTVRSWLRNAEAARSVVLARDGACCIGQLVEQNVRLQLMHLRTHPVVAAAITEGRLSLQGWVYGISDGNVTILNEETGNFEPLDTFEVRDTICEDA